MTNIELFKNSLKVKLYDRWKKIKLLIIKLLMLIFRIKYDKTLYVIDNLIIIHPHFILIYFIKGI